MVKSVRHLVRHLGEPPSFCKWATSTTPRPCPPEAEIVDHFAGVRGRRFLVRLVDFFHDGVEAAKACDGVVIGLRYGLAKNHRFCLGHCLVLGCPGLENALDAVEMSLVWSLW